MNTSRRLRLFLEPSLLKSAVAGQHNFIRLIQEVAENARFRVEFHPESALDRTSPRGFSLTHMKPPPDRDGLVFRRVYHYPFWQIERNAARWEWDVTKAEFVPDDVSPKEATRFYRFWQKRLFGDAPVDAAQGDYIFVPLQGRLLDHRSFQSCSPVRMIEYCLEHTPHRKIVATLHPKEDYTAAELQALEQLEKKHPRLTLGMGEMEKHLQACAYVVTQNSAAAFSGYFFGKPALLFAKIDFHHIAVKADPSDLAGSFVRVEQSAPDFAKYLWWFWQDRCINAGRDDAKAKIAARFQRFGWPMK